MPSPNCACAALDLTLERADDGRWHVRGLPGQQQAGADPFAALEGLGELQLIGARLAVVAPSLGMDAALPRIDMRLRVDGDRVRAGVRAWPVPARTARPAPPVEGVLDFNRRTGNGDAYVGATKVDLAAWASLLDIGGIALEQGAGRAQAWARLRARRVDSITADVALGNIALRGAPIEAGGAPTRHRFPRLVALARWQAVDAGWRVDAPRLRVGGEGREHQLDGLMIADGEQYALRAQRIDAGPLLAALTLSDRLPQALRRWIATARPTVTLHGIDIAGRRGGALSASGRVAALGFRPVGRTPGIDGMGGTIAADSEGFTFRFDPASTVRFDWPTGFGVVHAVKLRGEAGGWREGKGWRVATHALRIDGQDLGVDARGGLWWQGDGTRPWIDIAAELDSTVIPVGKGFWLRQDMPASAVHWLDTGLVAGQLHEGRAVISGDLDNWPFGADSPGFFEATGKIRDATIRFQEEWPPAQDVDVDALFTARGFEVTGSGRLGDVAIPKLRAGIDSYRGGALTVDAQGAGDAAQLLEVLRHSPLQKEHGQTLESVSASGPADVGFALRLPLAHEAGGISIGGTVALKNARLADKRWKLAFEQVEGQAEWSRAGFGAQDLTVRHKGEPGRLSLRAGGPYVRDDGHVFEADMEASLAAADLLDRAEEMAWLKPYLDGRSQWTVGLAIPKTAPGASAPTLLQLRSDLVGTRLDLPAPLRKSAGSVLATSVETPLPLGSGDIRVALGRILAVRARSTNGQTGVRVELGQDSVEEAPPASGLVAVGQADSLDAIDWIALARGGSGESRVPLQRIDVTARRLRLLGAEFPETRVRVMPGARGAIAVQAEGRALEGALMVPAAEGEAIAGKFERVHWRSPPRAGAGAATAGAEATAAAGEPAQGPAASATTTTSRDDEIDPSRIPALVFEIQDLRVADAALGTASIRTRPSATGMRIEQLQTRAPLHRLAVTGDWNGRGNSARTHIALGIDSDDYGTLLTGLGIGGRIAGGEGKVQLDAAWPGSPLVFRLESLEGSLVVDTRDGRLLEIEPGAGRVLGLLSLAQIPRRLTLDFRDFFAKGFSFDQLGGTVRFGSGQARSEALVIDGPAATIDIRGTADLRAQRYDQTIEVRPKAGNLLTAIGAVAGGPVGAAIGAAANVVLNKPLGSLASKTYRVTGPFKEPKVEVVSREESRAATTAAVPQG
nr:YhdP family protein [Lysobacter solisilvae]